MRILEPAPLTSSIQGVVNTTLGTRTVVTLQSGEKILDIDEFIKELLGEVDQLKSGDQNTQQLLAEVFVTKLVSAFHRHHWSPEQAYILGIDETIKTSTTNAILLGMATYAKMLDGSIVVNGITETLSQEELEAHKRVTAAMGAVASALVHGIPPITAIQALLAKGHITESDVTSIPLPA